MKKRRTRNLFHLSLGLGTAIIITGGLLVAGSLSPLPVASMFGEYARTVGTVLLQIGIVLELVAVSLHERLTERDIRRELSFATTMQASVMPGGN